MHLVQQIGSYAGLAAIPALCLLSALCFSQARDVRRLREWAGRAPERAAEAARALQQVPLATPPAASPAAVPSSAAPAPAEAPRTEQVTAGVPQTAPAARPPALPQTAAAPTTALPRTASSPPLTPAGGAPFRRPPAEGPPPLRRPPPVAPLLGDPSPGRFHRPSKRTFGLVAIIVAALAAAAALAVTQLSGGSSTRTSSQAPSQSAPVAAPPRVAVLNGTGVKGLGAKMGARVRASGLTLGKVGNTADKHHATSLVLYAPGEQSAAQMVRGKLGIARTGPSDSATEAAGKGAPVIVVVGSDGAGAR